MGVQCTSLVNTPEEAVAYLLKTFIKVNKLKENGI